MRRDRRPSMLLRSIQPFSSNCCLVLGALGSVLEWTHSPWRRYCRNCLWWWLNAVIALARCQTIISRTCWLDRDDSVDRRMVTALPYSANAPPSDGMWAQLHWPAPSGSTPRAEILQVRIRLIGTGLNHAEVTNVPIAQCRPARRFQPRRGRRRTRQLGRRLCAIGFVRLDIALGARGRDGQATRWPLWPAWAGALPIDGTARPPAGCGPFASVGGARKAVACLYWLPPLSTLPWLATHFS